MGTHHRADRVDLKKAQSFHKAIEVTARYFRSGARACKSLRRQRHPTRHGKRYNVATSRHRFTLFPMRGIAADNRLDVGRHQTTFGDHGTRFPLCAPRQGMDATLQLNSPDMRDLPQLVHSTCRYKLE